MKITFKVHIDVPDYLVWAAGSSLKQFTLEHACSEIKLNGGVPAERWTYRVSMLPDQKGGLTNYSRLNLEIGAGFPKGIQTPWKTARYPGRLDYEARLKKEE